MLCYRDMTFCPYSDCAKFKVCKRALTEEVLGGAGRWWESFHIDGPPPICQFVEKTDCFREIEE